MRTKRVFLVPFVVAALTVATFTLLTACSSTSHDAQVAGLTGESSTSATTTPNTADAVHKYYQCLQQEGLKVQEPQDGGLGNSSGKGAIDLNGVDQKKAEQAMQKCAQLLPDGGAPKITTDQQAMNVLLEQAKCLRAHGIDVADPTPGQLGVLKAPQGTTPEAFQKALDACVPGLNK